MSIEAKPGIMEISLYQGGKSAISGVSDVVKLSSNENPFGPSKRASDAVRQAAGNLHLYPSTNHDELRQAIGEIHRIDPSQVICGVGSDEIISLICNAFSGEGDEVLYTEHGFGMYKISALAAGATPVVAAEKDRKTDVEALLEACTEDTKIVFLANPNNPTGTMIEAEEVARLADNLPDTTLLVLDGAYAEYVDDFDGGIGIVDERNNVLMTRTFSKIYGLGGLRIGWGYAPQNIIDILNRLRGPFNLSSPALIAAEAAVRDQEYVSWCRSQNTKLKDWMTAELAKLGVPCDFSHGNFVLARFQDASEADLVDEFLQTKGLIVRKVGSYGLPHCLRITIGDEVACKRVVKAIAEART